MASHIDIQQENPQVHIELQKFNSKGLNSSLITVGKVFLNGVELRDVRAIKVEAGYNRVTEVTITMIASVTADIADAETTLVEAH
jgi:hypothetical protein